VKVDVLDREEDCAIGAAGESESESITIISDSFTFFDELDLPFVFEAAATFSSLSS
jgi:hypothetical protein